MGKRKGSRATTTMSFHHIVYQAMTASVAQIAMKPTTLSARFQQEADAWTLFKVSSCRFRCFADATATIPNGGAAVGVVEGAPATMPASMAQISELFPSVAHNGASESRWSRWISVPSAVCAGEFPWYQTFVGALQNIEGIPFTFCFFSGSATGTIALEVIWTVEFKSQCDIGNTPFAKSVLKAIREERQKQILGREQQALLEALRLPGPGVLATPVLTKIVGTQ